MTEILRYISDGSAPDLPPPDGLDDKGLLQIFRWVITLRTFDQRAVSLQRQGRIGTYPPFSGEEATQAGALYACRDTDWVFPSYRQNAIGILRGLDPSVIFKYRRGYGGSYGFWNPRELRVAPICIPIGTHLPHAVGLAWAAKMRGDDVASLVWFGDGATSEGDFHEAMNFAAVFKTPTVFLCVNNQWAISTPITKQMANTTIAEKADAYGMAGARVDGFDPVACWAATNAALVRARAGDGPTLIEALCYRLGPHATADDPSLYRDQAEAERWRSLEPLERMAGYLERLDVLDDAKKESMLADARKLIDDAVEDLEKVEPPGAEVLFSSVYATERPWTLREQLTELS